METTHQQKSVSTVTGMFATGEDAENAYETLLGMGYRRGEITMIMSPETYESQFGQEKSDGQAFHFYKNTPSGLSGMLMRSANYVAIPGLSVMVAGELGGSAWRALSNTVLSDQYAEYFQRSIRSGEILIEFSLHSASEKNTITDVWENYGGHPLVRRINNAA